MVAQYKEKRSLGGSRPCLDFILERMLKQQGWKMLTGVNLLRTGWNGEADSCFIYTGKVLTQGCILGRSPGCLNFVRWHLIFVGPQCGTCFMSSLWRLEFLGGTCSFRKFVNPCFNLLKDDKRVTEGALLCS